MRIILIVIAMLLASCSGISMPSFTPHKIEIRQGNLITPEMRGKLKLGMSRAQVRAALGTPLLSDALHANRWDYVYRLEQEGKLTKQQRMMVYFDGDVLVRIDDGTMPPPPAAESAVAVAPVAPVAPVAATPAPVEVVPEPPAEPVVVAAPVIKPVAKPGIAAPVVEQAVVDAVKGWAAAWSARDVEKFFARYSHEFKPDGGISRAAWEARRRARIAEAETITVELSDIQASMHDVNRASVSFKQYYRADSNKFVMRKTLELEKVGDAWLIVSERAAEK